MLLFARRGGRAPRERARRPPCSFSARR